MRIIRNVCAQMTHRCLYFLGCFLLASLACADTYDDWQRMRDIPRRGYVAYQAKTRLKIDGKLDDASWQAVPWSEPFLDIEGSVKPRPRFETRMKMLWDRKYFYFAAFLPDPHIWGTLTKHDSVIFHDNDFEVFIDPDGDTHAYYEFEMNALNTGWDLFLDKPYKDGGKADNGWEIPGLKTAVHIEGTLNDPSDMDQYWSVEIAIPWNALRKHARRSVPPKHGDQWRVNFSRVEWKHQIVEGRYQKIPNIREDNWVWSAQGIIDMHRPEKWGLVQFSKGCPGTTELLADPSIPARDVLMTIYHKQKAHFQKSKQWWTSLDELDLPAATAAGVVIESRPGGFHAKLKLQDGRTVHVTEDSRLWIE